MASSTSGLGPLLVIIDEDPQFSRWLRATLEAANYCMHELTGSAAADASIEALDAAAVVLDLAAVELDRLGVIQRIRSASDVPIVVVTARAHEHDKISALDAGADDYLTKPVPPGELLARLRVALRHGRARRGLLGGRVRVGDLSIDLLARDVILRGERLALTPTDYRLLALLTRNIGRVVPHQQLLHEAWGPNARDPHYLRVYMARLRRKLDPERAGARYIVTEAGVGYRLLAELRP